MGSWGQESCKDGFEVISLLYVGHYNVFISAFEANVTNPLEHWNNKGGRFIFKILTYKQLMANVS